MATYYTDSFELNKCVTAGYPFLVSWDQTNSTENIVSSCNGSITNLTFSGGTPPYSFRLTYPDGSVSADTTNFTNLCGGVYTATTADSLSNITTSFINILTLSAGTLTTNILNSSCNTNINEFCQVEVSAFTHTQDKFNYLLYKDNNFYSSFEGRTGDENYTFSNLTHGNYTLTAYDGISPTYLSQKTELCTCLDGYTLDSSQAFGKVYNTYTGLSATEIVSEWRRSNLFQDYFFSWSTTQGPHLVPPFNLLSDSILFESGLDGEGNVRVDDPNVWLYTGETSTRKTENTVNWYLGAFNLSMEEGDNVGPGGYIGVAANDGVFYYNTVINKFVILRTSQSSSDVWVTIYPTKNRGQNVYPIGTTGSGGALTGVTEYTAEAIPPTFQVGYTVTGSTNDCVQWDNLVGISKASVILRNQGNIPTNLISTCKYLNYTHQVSIGSTENDDDYISIILAAFTDDNGLYSPKGTSHFLTLNFQTQPTLTNPNSISIEYNGLGNTAYSFQDKNRTSVYCGADSPCTKTAAFNPVTPISGFSSIILANDSTKSPFSVGAWRNQGTAYVKIVRSGILGEKFNIKIAGLATSAKVGTSLPFDSNYEIDFNILDKSTWVGNLLSAENYANVEDLYKFLGSQSIGYYHLSQPESYFYNISFTGTQSNYYFKEVEFGASDTDPLDGLGDPNFQGVETSTSKETNFYNSIGGGGQVGQPTIPTVRPIPTVTMQTVQIPLMETTGGTKINASTDEYVIYSEPNLQANQEEPCVEFTFTWTKNTTDLLNGNMIPYYSIHPYDPINKTFGEATSVKIFDNPKGREYILTNNKQVIGQGIKATDCVKIGRIGDGSEFLLKPNYIFKDKLKNLQSTPCGPINESVNYIKTGITKTEKWYDTFDPNPDFKTVGNKDITGIFSWESDGKINTREYGLYDSTTDFYFLKEPDAPIINLETNNILYPLNDSCGKLATKQVETLPVLSGTSGTTTEPFVFSGTPFVVTLNFPTSGPLQVTLNGLTLFASSVEDLSDGGDYYFNGTNQVKFRIGIVEPYDVINIIYVPGTFTRSYYYDNYVVPATIPVVSGGTSTSGNTLYTNGFYYYFKTTYTPIGDVGITLNGTVLTQDADFKLISNDTIQFTGIEYPSGLSEDDIIGQFYFTRFNLLGTSGVKNPQINAVIPQSEIYTNDLLLVVRDTSGRIVYTENKTVEANSLPNLTTQSTTNVLSSTFTVQVPSPGTYTYNVIATTKYKLINGDTISNSSSSESYDFSISAAVFYDESGDNTINTTTNVGY